MTPDSIRQKGQTHSCKGSNGPLRGHITKEGADILQSLEHTRFLLGACCSDCRDRLLDEIARRGCNSGVGSIRHGRLGDYAAGSAHLVQKSVQMLAPGRGAGEKARNSQKNVRGGRYVGAHVGERRWMLHGRRRGRRQSAETAVGMPDSSGRSATWRPIETGAFSFWRP